MRLAGQVRLRNFLVLAALGVVLVSAGAVGAVMFVGAQAPPAQIPAPNAVPVAAPDAVPEAAPVAPEAAPIVSTPQASGVREVDTLVLSYQGKDIGTDKLKDVTKGKPYKVNLYQDAESTSVDRAKIDLDRDDKWDEKITFAPDKITRQVASKDDEFYDQTLHWNGTAWQ